MIFGKAIGSAGVMQAFVVKDNEEKILKAPKMMMKSAAQPVSESPESLTIYGNAIGCVGMAQTYVFEDEEGNEVYGVIVQNETELTATENDIRLGKLAVTGIGLTNGHKEIPAYNTTEGVKIITAGSEFSLPIEEYQYTKLQALICAYNTNLSNSVATERVAINDNVYDVLSTETVAEITIDNENKCINFGINNDSDSLKLIRYFSYKEIY